jgi:hypothetical protein
LSFEKYVAITLKHMLTSALELPKEEPIEEQIRIQAKK